MKNSSDMNRTIDISSSYSAPTRKEWILISETDMTPGEVTDYFFKDFKIRKFNELLTKFYKESDLKQRLTNKFSEFDPDIKYDSLRKKISNWLLGQNEPTEREDYIKICFALGFDEASSQAFLRYSSDGGFHLRDPREIIYLYCLRSKKDFFQAQSLISQLIRDKYGDSLNNCDSAYTKSISDTFFDIHDDEAFLNFFEANYQRMGVLHNTAYKYFTQFFNELVIPSTPLYTEAEEEYSVEQVVDTYLRMNLPFERNTSKYDAVKKAIRIYWPNITVVMNIRNRKTDVSRKILLLLYIVTEGISDAIEAIDPMSGLEDNYYERLEEHVWKIDLMLSECGMSQLDPRNPFDWLIIYSLKTGSEDKYMSERLSEVLKVLF